MGKANGDSVRKKREEYFASEAEMCAAFAAEVKGRFKNWTIYPETAGWDMLLSRDEDGFQIGVQAKLKLNGKVIIQAAETASGPYYSHVGPDCRAVMVPANHGTVELLGLCSYVGLTVITVSPRWFNPQLPSLGWAREWHEMLPLKRHSLPEYVPDVAAGVAAPVQLTEWKIGALKLCLLLEHRGWLTREDFKRIGIDHRRWIAPGSKWLKPTEQGYVEDTHLPDFKGQHPQVWEQIKADPSKWLPQ